MHLPTHGGTPADVTPGLGIDGVALTVEVRRSWPAVLLVVVTGHAEYLDRLAPGSCEKTYVKPFEPS